MALFGFIGMGNMGYAMLNGMLSIYSADQLTFTDVDMEKKNQIKEKTGVDYKEDNVQLVNACKFIVLAIKPQYLSNVIDEIKDAVTENQIIISILPGVATDDLKKDLGKDVKIVRAMPNTPALVGEGMSGVCFSDSSFAEEEKKTVLEFFGSFGKYEVVEERLMNAVVCASGSSPAYVYMFIEALADSAVKYGIPRDKAYTFAAQTVLGSAKMVLDTKEHPGKLKDMVCSPGGTTIAAVSALEEYGFRNAIIKAADSCYEKTVSFKK